MQTLGVKFDDYHSFEDFGLILKKKNISPAPRKNNWIDIPGTNGKKDLSTVNTDGEPKYDNRPLDFTFDLLCRVSERISIYTAIKNAIHGLTMNIVLDEDPDYYYVGVVSVESTEDTALNHSTITVSVDAEPYKYSLKNSIDDWLWDPFSFINGVIYKSITNVQLHGTREFIIPILRMPVVPTFITTAPLTVEFRDVEYSVPAGSSVVPNIVLTTKYHTLKITAQNAATLTIEIRNGAL